MDFPYYSVRAIDPATNIIESNGGKYAYMAYGSNLTIHDAIKEYRRKKERK